MMQAFNSLSVDELNAVILRMTCKEYKSGEVLWRTGNRLDFWGFLHEGNLAIEYRINGLIIHSVLLKPGDCVLPRDLRGINRHLSISASAMTDIRLYVLRVEQSAGKPDHTIAHSTWQNIQRIPWQRYWVTAVTILILFLTWGDVSRVISGALYLSSQARQTTSQESMQLLGYAESLDADAAFVYNQEGTIWYQENNLKDAAAAFSQALRIENGNGPALNNLAVVHFKTRALKNAADLQKEAVKNGPDSAIAHYNLGLVFMGDSDTAKAMREFREASQINPAWVFPYIQQGLLYLQRHDDVNAERMARKAIALDTTQQFPYLMLAVGLYNQDNNTEALRSVDRALKIAPDDRIAAFYKARIFANLGRYEAALALLRKLLESTQDQKEIFRLTTEIEALQRSMPNSLIEIPSTSK